VQTLVSLRGAIDEPGARSELAGHGSALRQGAERGRR
jgi:hypothetical protein